jgi:hypothetical protein
VALMIHAGQRIFGTIGPSRAMATPDGSLYLLSHGKLHVFGPDGMRRQAIDLATLGVPVRPSDFEIHRDGRLVITDPDHSVLHRCELPRGPCQALEVGLRGLPGQEVLPLNAAKLHIDDEAKRYYISDNFGHRILIADFDGRVLAQSPRGSVHHPNQLSLRKRGELTVVDTDYHRLVTFDVTGDRVGRVVGNMATDAPEIARPGRVWPFDSVRLENGETWVLIARGHMQDADVIAFDDLGKARRRVALDDDADPFDIEPWRGRVWVSDATHYRFESVALDGTRGQIEDREFAAELAREREVPGRWRAIRTAAQVGMVLIPALGIFILWKLGLVWSGGAAPADLGPQPRSLITIRVILVVATVVAVVLVLRRVFRLL